MRCPKQIKTMSKMSNLALEEMQTLRDMVARNSSQEDQTEHYRETIERSEEYLREYYEPINQER